jgi:hypothetical protein
MELDPIADYELTDLGHIDDFLKSQGYGGRDVGAEIRIAPLHKRRWLQLDAGAFRGNADRENAAAPGLVSARAESKPFKSLTLGASFADMPSMAVYAHPFQTANASRVDQSQFPPPTLSAYATHHGAGKAWEADFSMKKAGFRLRGEIEMGDRLDLDTTYGARKWRAGWALVAYKISLGDIGLMPAARVEYLDADLDRENGARRMMSFAINLLFSKTSRLVVEVSRTDVEPGSPLLNQPTPLPLSPGLDPSSGQTLPPIPYLDLSRTKLITQLQLVF